MHVTAPTHTSPSRSAKLAAGLILGGLAFGLPSCVIGIDLDDNWSKAKRNAIYDIGQNGATTLKVNSRNGFIRVRADDTDTIHCEAQFYAKGHDMEEARMRVSAMEVVTHRSGDELHVSIDSNNLTKRWGAQLVLTVPQGLELDLRSSNGSIHVDGDFPTIVADTSNGGVETDCRNGGRAMLSSSNGPLVIHGSPSIFQAYTSNGSVSVNLDGDWSGEGVVRTSNGPIRVESPGQIHAAVSSSTSNGKVYSNLANHRGNSRGRLKLNTSNGSIRVHEGA